MPNWGMNPQELFNAGGNISNLRTDADAAVGALRNSFSGAMGAVGNSVVSGGLDALYQSIAPTANNLPNNVDGGGKTVSKVASDGNGTDLANAGLVGQNTSEIEGFMSLIKRPLNADV